LPTGPLALLPLPNPQQCSIVWSCKPERAAQLLAMPAQQFNQALTAASNSVLGVLQLHTEPKAFGLKMRYASSWLRGRAVLVADAAHSIHPLAGQGVNLGLLDAAELTDVLKAALGRGERPSDLAVLQRYERRRMGANLGVMAAMEGFERLFDADALSLRWLRNAGMQWLDRQGTLKSMIIRRAMGLTGRLPMLARHAEEHVHTE